MSAKRRSLGNVPVEATRLVGRRMESAQVVRGCERSRLVTVTGVGGVGKTRLAQRAATELGPGFRDGAWWVELSPVSRGDVLPYALGEALGMADQTTRPMLEVVADYLADRETLLVLDTCEHLVDGCRDAVAALLDAAPGLRVLATSRRPLGLPSEEVLTLEPLPLPAEDAPSGAPADGQEEADAVVLLAERAALAVPGFEVDADNRAEVVRLCRRLEGLPLALELAAARLRELSLSELNRRLADRLAVLGETREVAHDADPPWHQALRTAIGWSHQLCTPAERLLWARLAVFVGGFDAETARRVCAYDHLPADEVASLLGSLVEKSILIWQPTGAGEGYRMLDTLREFGLHWLRGLGEEDRQRRRHRDHYRALAHEADAAWLGRRQFAWYDRMIGEHDNLRAALEFCLAEPGGTAALELSGALWFFWYGCGHLKEGRHYLDRALSTGRGPGRGSGVASRDGAGSGDGAGAARVRALWASGLVLVGLGDAEGCEARGVECLAAAESRGDDESLLCAHTVDLVSAAVHGDMDRMEAVADLILTMRPDDGPITLATLLALQARSHVRIFAGRPEEALPQLERLRLLCERNGEQWMRAFGDYFRAQAELALDRPEAARRYALAALRVKHRMHDRMGSGLVLDVLAAATGAADQVASAAQLLGLAQQLWETLGVAQLGQPHWVAVRRACEARAREALGDDAYSTAFRSGYDAVLDVGIAHALRAPGADTGTPGAPYDSIP